MLKNKKGFTLIELIIVVAIMAVLVALLAPNVLKYLEKSKVGKDINTLDSVRLAIEAELMDEDLCTLKTDGDAAKLQGKLLSAIKSETTGDWGKLSTRLFGTNRVLDDSFATTNIFTSTTAKGKNIKVFLDGKGGIAVAAVGSDNKVITYDGKDLLVSTKINVADLDCK